MRKLAQCWNQTRWAQKIRDTGLSKKLMLIYMLLVLCPGILAVYLMNSSYYKILWEKYCQNEENAFRSEVGMVESRMNDISKLSAYFTSNSVLMDYMGTEEMSVADSVYDYMKYFKTIFQIAGNSNPSVNSMTIYTRAAHDFRMTGQLEDLEENSVPEKARKSVKGFWELTCEGEEVLLTYYEPIYTIDYRKFLGVLKISADPMKVMDCFTEDSIYFELNDSQIMIEKDKNGLRRGSFPKEQEKGHFRSFVSKTSKYLDGTFFTVVTMPEDFWSSFIVMLLPSFLMILLLPLVYLGMMNRQMKRIENFSKYISQNHTPDSEPYQEKQESEDEIGVLIQVYNHNISEIRRMMQERNLAELQRKDSEFYALQAQIKPHFLYNTLENIRMTAEQEKDLRTASMLEILGKYMRYGLQKDLKYTFLTRELQHIRYYQKLMDIRFPSEISLSISVFTDISEVSCPYLLLQPIIENAIKHGKEPGGKIDIKVEVYEAPQKRKHRDIEIRISNNGRKISEERLEQIHEQLENGMCDEDGHVGLKNINYRLISCYGRDYTMRIENKEMQGCQFLIYLPNGLTASDSMAKEG